jgi:hypothetical protein
MQNNQYMCIVLGDGLHASRFFSQLELELSSRCRSQAAVQRVRKSEQD